MTAAGVATLSITREGVNPPAEVGGNAVDPAATVGLRWIGNHVDGIDRDDWSQSGADRVLREQDPAGSWNGDDHLSFGSGSRPVDRSAYDTPFAPLFLSRGFSTSSGTRSSRTPGRPTAGPPTPTRRSATGTSGRGTWPT